MKQLIKIQTNTDGKKAVSAREMYVGLGLEPTHWKRWGDSLILIRNYFLEVEKVVTSMSTIKQ